ncbi:hypothetical protein NDU88_006067 [Pleurodeles waltl]|uniref:Uncharacterized protein n=1 Tax=Pleurodeles waltl TaxID=8319 RepID=A0AAV7MY81_PLEWA|nr:hypothetical protein NDU88_006067 [Pleurodeles waltl]
MMSYYADDEEGYMEYAEVPYDQHMEEHLVEALNNQVDDSVKKALIKALRPFTQPLVRKQRRPEDPTQFGRFICTFAGGVDALAA